MSYKIEYDEEHKSHKIDGIGCPSVTNILTELKTKYYRQGAAQAGTDRHEACDLIDKGIELDAITEAERPYAGGWVKFKSDTGCRIVHIELPVGSKRLMYVGKIDRVIEINGEIIILDIKTGGKEKWHELQLSGYAFAYSEMGYRYNSIAALYLKGDGTYKLETMREYLPAFMGAVNMYRWMAA